MSYTYISVIYTKHIHHIHTIHPSPISQGPMETPRKTSKDCSGKPPAGVGYTAPSNLTWRVERETGAGPQM